ncbi:colicin uptake protein TolR [Providencia rustigianii]|nr:colicin uptake protein TolR [Providencia rustigianii]
MARNSRKRELKSEINIVPLLDVLFGAFADLYGNSTYYFSECGS